MEGYKALSDKLDEVMKRQSKIKGYLENLFGGEDLVGTPTEGSVTQQLRELNEKVKIQNGRVKALERIKDFWWAYVLGASGIVGFIITALGILSEWIKH